MESQILVVLVGGGGLIHTCVKSVSLSEQRLSQVQHS